MLGQSIGDPAMQPLEFGPAHLHRDVVLTEGWVGDEIQFNRIPMENRIAADRFVDQSLSHVRNSMLHYRTLCDEALVTTHCTKEWQIVVHESRAYEQEAKGVESDDELNYV